MPRSFAAPLRIAVLVLLAGALPALSDETARVRVDVEDDAGESFRLEIASSWLAPLLARLDVECEPSDDPDVRRMARHLDRRGDGASYGFRDEDGDPVLAVRQAGRLRLETTGEDGQRSTVEMPWQLAECFLLGREPEGGVGRLLGEGLRLDVDDRDGEGRVRVRID